MPEIIKCYRQKTPAHRLIGMKYGDADRVNGSFGAKWSEWFQNDRFGRLERSVPEGSANLGEEYGDCGAYLGFMRCSPNEPFEYWIGIFFTAGTPVPESFEYIDLPAGDLGTCWIYGKESEGLYGMHDACYKKMEENGFSVRNDFGNDKEEFFFFERYACPRFTTDDEKGNKILDYCFYIK